MIPEDLQPHWDGETVMPTRRRSGLRATRAFFIGVVLTFLVAAGWNLGVHHGPRPALARCYPEATVCSP